MLCAHLFDICTSRCAAWATPRLSTSQMQITQPRVADDRSFAGELCCYHGARVSENLASNTQQPDKRSRSAFGVLQAGSGDRGRVSSYLDDNDDDDD